jgi:hypothetical protein
MPRASRTKFTSETNRESMPPPVVSIRASGEGLATTGTGLYARGGSMQRSSAPMRTGPIVQTQEESEISDTTIPGVDGEPSMATSLARSAGSENRGNAIVVPSTKGKGKKNRVERPRGGLQRVAPAQDDTRKNGAVDVTPVF